MAADSENGPDDLEKLLAEVQRTIRDNDQFIRHLKDEAADADADEAGEVSGDEVDVDDVDDVEYEEL